MADIKPFRAIRPRQDFSSRIAALPYDVYNREEAKAEVLKEPYSFLKIDRAETQFPDEVDTYDSKVYQKAHDILQNMIAEESFIQEEEVAYYLYELTMNGRVQTGIVACASSNDYETCIIKKHENTRADKEIDRIKHVDVCNAQTGPIFLAYRARKVLNEIVEETKKDSPLYDFVSNDGIRHRVFIIKSSLNVEKIRKEFSQINEIYIADGHHRCASAVKVCQMRREKNSKHTGSEEYNYFLSVLFPDEQLMIMDYNRVVKDLNGLSKEELLLKIEENFNVTRMGANQVSPKRKGEFGMYVENEWYQLQAKSNILDQDAVEGLDVSILQKYLLAPILGIGDSKTDQRIDFVGGIRGLEELEKRVHTDCQVAFSMYPTSIAELFAVADDNRLMPPKSTWFEPKLRSGLFIHDIS